MRNALTAIIAIGMIAFPIWAAVATSTTRADFSVESGITPQSPVYKLDAAFDTARMRVANDGTGSGIDVAIDVAGERLDESILMASHGNFRNAEMAAEEYSSLMSYIEELDATAHVESESLSELKTHYTQLAELKKTLANESSVSSENLIDTIGKLQSQLADIIDKSS